MSLSRNHIKLIIITAFCAYFIASVAYAAPNNSGILDKITTDFETAARSWGSIILSYAEVLFWSLGVISLVYTSCMLFLKDSGMNAQGFFAHLIKFIMFFGFFLFLLRNGPYIGGTIINSLLQVGARATGTGATSASEFMDVAFDVFGQVLDSLSLWSPGLSLLLAMIAVLLLLILSLVAANLAIEYCAAWILLYAGCFFLGFGGSHWTSDIAIQYFKAVLGSAVRLMAMTMILGIAASIVTATAANMSEGPNGKDAATLLVTALIVLSIMNKIPNMLAGIVGGGQGAGNLGTGAMMAAAGLGMAAGAAVSGAASSMGVTSAMANGASAAKEAVSQGFSSMVGGTGAYSSGGASKGGSAFTGGSFSSAVGSEPGFASPVSSDSESTGSSMSGANGDGGSNEGGSGTTSDSDSPKYYMENNNSQSGKTAGDYLAQSMRDLGNDLEK